MNLFDVYPLYNINIVKGDGCKVWDENGTEYLDLYGGHAVISIGHAHPHYVAMISNQVAKLGFYSNSVINKLQQEVAERLGKISGYEDYSLFLINSGAEANENALKLASFHNGRTKIVSFSKAFHGRTSLAVEATHNPSIIAPINNNGHVTYLPLNDMEAMKQELSKGDTCAVIIEGIQGVGGIKIPTTEFMQELRKTCSETGTILILDEIQSGYGRSGKFFAHQYNDIKPDIITVAKGIGNGFPMAGVLISPMFKPVYGQLGTTFGGNHLALSLIHILVFGNVLRNGTYPISVSSERIFQGLAIARYANEIGADAVAHGSTGAGNDQIRFDMTFLVLAPNVEIITLTRDMALSRQEEIDYLNKHGFSADFTKLKYSYNVGLWGTSICGGEILDSAQGLPETAYLKHVEKEGSEQLRLTFEKGELKAVNDEKFDDPIKAIQKVEEIGAAYGIGRDMHVGDTIIGIKGRVGFEAAAPMLIIGAHRFLEKYTLSKWQQYWKDQVANWYGMFLHESQYLEPVMRDIEAMLQESQRNVNGTAILELRPLSFSTVGVESKDDLVKTKFGEYGEMQKGWTAEDAKGFIKVTSTPLRVYYNNHKDEEI